MSTPLRVLIIEDSEDDALLVSHDLEHGGYDLTFERVDTAAAMSAALEQQTWDVILADYAMPHFSVPAALGLLKERHLDLPFIIVSGAIGEETAAGAMRAGAHDFVMKGHLARLIPAIERELHEAKVRQEHKQAQKRAQELETLRELDRLRARLLANVSHELRTPLSSIKGFATTLLAPDVKWSEEKQRDFLQCIDQETDRLTRMVDDLVDMSRLQFGALKLEKGNYQISEILDSVSNKLASLTKHHRVQVIVPGQLPAVSVDDMRIRQVLTNLIESVTGFSEKGSLITIEAKPADNQIIVSVSGRSEGIPSQLSDRVFDWFYHTESRATERKSGTGLALPICRGIIEAHGGKIWVESREVNGVTFSFSLPASEMEDRVAQSSGCR